jgi:hypothetical protein
MSVQALYSSVNYPRGFYVILQPRVRHVEAQIRWPSDKPSDLCSADILSITCSTVRVRPTTSMASTTEEPPDTGQQQAEENEDGSITGKSLS